MLMPVQDVTAAEKTFRETATSAGLRLPQQGHQAPALLPVD